MTTSGHEQDVKEYEFSPVGHITIDANGRIIEIKVHRRISCDFLLA